MPRPRRTAGRALHRPPTLHPPSLGQVVYLFQDCNDALVKIEQAFAPGDVDLPEGGTTAPLAAITLPDAALASLGAGGLGLDAFPCSIEFGGPGAGFSLTQDSFTLADEVSTLLPSSAAAGTGHHASHLEEDERFDFAGDAVERHLSLGGGEALRDATMAPAGAVSPGLFGAADADAPRQMAAADIARMSRRFNALSIIISPSPRPDADPRLSVIAA